MALSRFAAIEDADCLIVQARNFVGELVAVLQFVPWGKDGLSLTWCAVTLISRTG